MDTPPFCVNIGINKEYYTTALVDSACLCYGTINDGLVRKLRLPRIAIRPRSLDQVITVVAGVIRFVTYLNIDIDGYSKKRIFLYILPNQSESIILGRTWMNTEKVVIYPAQGKLYIGQQDHWVTERSSIVGRQDITGISAATFMGYNKRNQETKQQGLLIYSASLRDIEKALAPKKRTDPRSKLPECYQDYLSVFDYQQADKLPPHRPGIDHQIPLQQGPNGKDLDPPWGPLYGMTRDELIVLRKTLTELLDKNFIRVSSSPASAPILFVKKPGGGLRFCVDYRGINAISKKDRYPLPLIDETLRSLSRAKWLTKLDVIAAFHKIRVQKGDEWKTAFRTRYGLFEWLVTPFGLTGAPATFQRYINTVLRDYLDEFVSAYIDDILIYTSGSIADHRTKVRAVLQRLKDAGLQIDIDKCEFETTSVKYLGFIIEAGKGIRVDPEKVAAIKNWQTPTTVTGVRSFLGFANFYRRFISGFSITAGPLTDLTKKDISFQWSSKCQEAFNELKEQLITAPLLAQWDPDKETLLETDSSGWAIGGALSQRQDNGIFQPVAFFSKKNAPAECNYPIHDKELLAIIRCLQQWNSELRSVPTFTILTDHLNLKYFTTKQRLTERQVRWSEELAPFNFTIQYRPGKEAIIPDTLSRREQDIPQDHSDERLQERIVQLLEENKQQDGLITVVHAGYITKADADQIGDPEATRAPLEEIQSNQETENNISTITEILPDTTNTPVGQENQILRNPFLDPSLRQLWHDGISNHNRYWLIRQAVIQGDRRLPTVWGLPITLSECSIDNGNRLCWRDRIWVPDSEPLRTAIIQQIHDSVLSGHPGRDVLKSLLSRRYYWPGLDPDVRQFVGNCNVCGRSGIWRDKKRGLLKPLPVPSRIWSELSIDFITDLPPTKLIGATNLMVITDRLSKSVIFEPLVEITTDSVARALLTCLIRHHGIPIAIVTDRGTQFTSQMCRRLCQLLQIQQRISTAWHPETDGSTERMNQEIERYIRMYTVYAQDDWDELLPIAALAINNKPATSIGMSPFFLTHGYNIDPIAIREQLRSTGETPIARAEVLIRRFREAAEWAQVAMAAAQENQEHYANTRRQPADQFKTGDKVWLRLRNIRSDRPSKKLDWISAKYTVIETIGSHACRLNTPPGIHNVFHVSLLRLSHNNPLPSQQQLDDYQPPALLTETGEIFEVERILQTRRNGREVLVKWIGYTKPTWEPTDELTHTSALADYEAQHGPLRS